MKKLFALAVVLVAMAALWFWGRPAYRASKERKFAAQAQEALATNDLRRALLSARQVLALNPDNVSACRVMAVIADLSGSPHALVWHRRIVELDPTVSNRIALASCALRYEQPPFGLATEVLEQLASEASNNVAFHVVSAQLALKQNRRSEAEQHFVDAGRLDPANPLHRLNLAVVRLQAPVAAAAAAARADLEKLQNDPKVGEHALRSLAAYHLTRKEYPAAQEFSNRLLAHPSATFLDRLEHLNILHAAGEPAFDGYLIRVQEQAATNAVYAAELGSRLLAMQEPVRALAWLKDLPAEIREQPPVPITIANIYAAQKDWRNLEQFLSNQNWKDQEYLRWALLARSVREQEDEGTSATHWSKAVELAAERSELLGVLAQTAGSWGWHTEAENLLWRVVKDYPKERWALDALHNAYTRGRQTHGLLAIYATLMERADATNLLVQNNYASLSLLVGTNMDRAHKLAEQVYRAAPTSAAFASTYAWSLHVQGRTQEGLKIMEQFGEKLSHPSLASYYGAMLAAAGQKEKAREYLAKTENAPMFPEEKAIVAQAHRKL